MGDQLARTQFEYFHAFGKWQWWIRGTDGLIIAKCLRPLREKEECLEAIEAVRRAGRYAPIVFIGVPPP